MAAEAPTAETRRSFRIFRYGREGGSPRYEGFDVPVGPSSTVLDGLRWVRLHRDPTLSIRHSCFHASCGTCGVRVNGREALACVTAIDDLGDGPITVEPMANLPVLSDLVVDMTSFIERFPPQHPLVRGSEGVAAEAGAYERFEDCIECGLCLSACPVAATDDTYVGPAALAYAQRVLEESDGVERDAILAWADQDNAAWRCHAAFECTEACPSDVRPAQRIMALRRALTLGGSGRS